MTVHPAVAFAALILLGGTGCGQPKENYSDPVMTNPPDTIEITPPPSTIATIVTPAEATVMATPVVERTTTIPSDPCLTVEQTVNAISYQPDDPRPATEAYRLEAACLGWSQATIDFYEPGIIYDLFPGESRYCWNLQRGQGITTDCGLFGPIQGDDTGFFQITSSAHGPTGVLCLEFGYCGSASIKQSPHHSMRSGLLLIMRSGKFPWTWDSDACGYHHLICSTWPKAWSNL